MELETRLASHHWDVVACRDTQKTYNLVDATELQALAPSFDFTAWSTAARIPAPAVAEVVVAQPSFLQGLAELLVEEELPRGATGCAGTSCTAARRTCRRQFVDANFEFYGRTLSGTDELRPRWKRGVGFVESAMGEAVGKIYVRTEFPPAAKERMSELIDHLIAAYRESITHAAVDERRHQGARAGEARARSPRRSAIPTSSRTTQRWRPTPPTCSATPAAPSPSPWTASWPRSAPPSTATSGT